MAKEEGGVIPIIDLQESPFPYSKLREACEKWGCFRVLNHNVPTSTMSEMKTVTRSLLDLPLEIKNRNKYPSPALGYIGFGPTNSIHESFGLLYPSHPGALKTFCSQLDASSNQREIMEKYTQSIEELIVDVSDKIAKSLGLSGRDLFRDWPWIMRMNKYSFTPETIGSYGVKSHTDPGFLTVLQDDDVVGGLEVADNSGSFVSIEPSPGSFFINLGDVAVAWSNGRFTTVKHKVKGIEALVRVSIVSFMVGPQDSTVEAPEELVDSLNPRLYTPFRYEDYRALRLANNMHSGEALSLLRVPSLLRNKCANN